MDDVRDRRLTQPKLPSDLRRGGASHADGRLYFFGMHICDLRIKMRYMHRSVHPFGCRVKHPIGVRMSNDIGDRLVQVRGGLSQAAFAELLGIGRASVQRYEQGKRVLDADLLARLWVLYSIDPLWLITGKSSTDPSWGNVDQEERRLVATFRALSPAGRRHLLEVAQGLTKLVQEAEAPAA